MDYFSMVVLLMPVNPAFLKSHQIFNDDRTVACCRTDGELYQDTHLVVAKSLMRSCI